MNAEQRAALRNLAEEATQGERIITREGFSTVYVEARIGGGMLQEIAAFGPCNGGQAEQQANAELCAAANPQSILELLDYIETLEKDAALYLWCKLHPERAASIFEHLGIAYFDSEIDAAMKGQ